MSVETTRGKDRRKSNFFEAPEITKLFLKERNISCQARICFSKPLFCNFIIRKGLYVVLAFTDHFCKFLKFT